jgi:hypothetical protein
MSKESPAALLHGRIAAHGTVPLVIAGTLSQRDVPGGRYLRPHIGTKLGTGSKHT